MKKIAIYTDGACSGNPGNGGYGVVLKQGSHRKELSQGYKLTTNNRMELLACIKGLEALKFDNSIVKMYTDSKYIVDSINKGWAKRWQANGWKRNKKEMAKNIDMWQRLLNLLNKHDVEFIWVKGHAGNSENECCDRLAVAASQGNNLLNDVSE